MAASLEQPAPPMQLTLRGQPLRVDAARHGAFWNEVAQGSWEPSTFDIFERFLSADHVYLDIGCWIGPTLLYGCQIARSAYGLEPDPLAYKELERNIELNRPLSDNVRLANLCIATHSGEVAFGSRGAGGDSTSSLLFGKKKTHWTVKALTFADFLAQYAIRDVNFIKMDIEGGEYAIIPTMADWLRAHRPTLHLSLHPCYLKLKPLGPLGRLIRRLTETRRLLHTLRFYRHIYDHHGRELSARQVLWACRAKISLDIVLTDLPWPVAPPAPAAAAPPVPRR
ncbi:MAG TPA: FkbM family methyltransferase [Steroidobacteraceae bacterium]|jgi:FkbM family methyltransferase|nr:FkbM family methyltransferase [Steroidobacteraceae bacterium]